MVFKLFLSQTRVEEIGTKIKQALALTTFPTYKTNSKLNSGENAE